MTATFQRTGDSNQSELNFMEQTWGCLFIQHYQGPIKMLKIFFFDLWSLYYKTDPTFKGIWCLPSILLLSLFTYFLHNISMFNILPLPQWLFTHTYGKLIFSIPAALIILACEGHLKPTSFDHQNAFLQCTEEKNERVWYNTEYLFSLVCSSHAPESVFLLHSQWRI